MRLILALAMVAACLGCIYGAPDGAGPTTTSLPIRAASTVAAPAHDTTTTFADHDAPPGALASCDGLNATFWRALCYDEAAYGKNDSRLCRTVYCKARLEGASVCDSVKTNSSRWRGYMLRACEAWAANSPHRCDRTLGSGDCIRWYAMLAGNYTLCLGAENNPWDDCTAEFAFWRGNTTGCYTHNTAERVRSCLAEYAMMEAADSGDVGYCEAIVSPKLSGQCRELAGYAVHLEDHPLYGIREQLYPEDG